MKALTPELVVKYFREPLPGECQCGCGHPKPRPGHLQNKPTRFSFEVDASTGCWNWTGPIGNQRSGYGRCGKHWAHRVSFVHFKGLIPDGLQIDHLCRNARCVNPDHLEAVTGTENCRRGNGTKLTPEDVVAIRASDELASVICKQYGVAEWHIRQVRKRRFWKDIEDGQADARAA